MTTDIPRHLEAGVLTLTFNRVGQEERHHRRHVPGLADRPNDAADDTAVRVVVLQGHADVHGGQRPGRLH